MQTTKVEDKQQANSITQTNIFDIQKVNGNQDNSNQFIIKFICLNLVDLQTTYLFYQNIHSLNNFIKVPHIIIQDINKDDQGLAVSVVFESINNLTQINKIQPIDIYELIQNQQQINTQINQEKCYFEKSLLFHTNNGNWIPLYLPYNQIQNKQKQLKINCLNSFECIQAQLLQEMFFLDEFNSKILDKPLSNSILNVNELELYTDILLQKYFSVNINYLSVKDDLKLIQKNNALTKCLQFNTIQSYKALCQFIQSIDTTYLDQLSSLRISNCVLFEKDNVEQSIKDILSKFNHVEELAITHNKMEEFMFSTRQKTQNLLQILSELKFINLRNLNLSGAIQSNFTINLLQQSDNNQKGLPQLKRLSLNQNNLINKLSAELFCQQHLNELQELYLNDNYIGIPFAIPEQVQLENLIILSLQRNQIREEGLLLLFSCQKLKNLRELLLSHNVKLNIPKNFQSQLSNLKHLSLQECFIDSDGSNTIFSCKQMELLENLLLDQNYIDIFFSKNLLVNLKILQASYNQLANDECQKLFESLPFIQILNLSYNQIELPCYMPFYPLQYLIDLNLSNNKIKDKGCQNLLNNLNLPNLKIINLSRNLITTPSSNKQISIITLEKLDLSFNKINKQGFTRLMKDLNQINIQELLLKNNSINQLILQVNTPLQLPKLQLLDLSSNQLQIVDNSFMFFSKGLGPEVTILIHDNLIQNIQIADEQIQNINQYNNDLMSGLKKINCAFNSLTENDFQIIMNKLSNPGVIEEIDLKKNIINCSSLQSNTSQFSKLKKFVLSQNNISAKGFIMLLKFLQASQLVYLDLSDNPMDQDNYQNENDFNLNYHQNEMQLTQIFCNLVELKLNNCQISSAFAQYIFTNKQLSNLLTLDLSQNKICSVIPVNIGMEQINNVSLTCLQTLILNQNQIDSKALCNIFSCKELENLQSLDFSENIIQEQFELTNKLINLKQLNMNMNLMEENILQIFLQDAIFSKTLVKMSLNCNQIKLPQHAIKLKEYNIRILQLSNNLIDQQGFQQILTAPLISLIKLDVTYNEIDNFDLNEANLHQLQYLLINYNPLSQTGFQKLLQCNGLDELKYIAIQNTNIQKLPNEIKLKKLSYIDINEMLYYDEQATLDQLLINGSITKK